MEVLKLISEVSQPGELFVCMLTYGSFLVPSTLATRNVSDLFK